MTWEATFINVPGPVVEFIMGSQMWADFERCGPVEGATKNLDPISVRLVRAIHVAPMRRAGKGTTYKVLLPADKAQARELLTDLHEWADWCYGANKDDAPYENDAKAAVGAASRFLERTWPTLKALKS